MYRSHNKDLLIAALLVALLILAPWLVLIIVAVWAIMTYWPRDKKPEREKRISGNIDDVE